MALAFALAASGCLRTQPPPPPSVVLILIDQLRADRLGVYGSKEGLTPFLDLLARKGFYFLNARAAAPWTYPSTVSLHTGLYPRVHRAERLRGAALRDRGEGSWWIRQVPSEITTLAEYLRARGYETAGFIANPYLKPESQFPRGFEHYEHDFVESWAVDPTNSHARWWKKSSHADTLNARVLDYLQDPKLPVFVYIHYIDVHGPWDQAPFLDEPCPPDADCTRWMESAALYRRAIRYVDRRIADLYSRVERIFAGQVIFVVTSDHGRALVPSDASNTLKAEKASLHDFNLRVPLLFAWTNAFPYSGSSTVDVSLIDVFPTLAGILFPDASLGLKLDGKSLVPLFEGRSLPRRTLFAENNDPLTGHAAQASIDDSVKFVEVTAPVGVHLEYDLLTDPKELAPPLQTLGTGQAGRLQALHQAFERMERRAAPDRPTRLLPETIEQLKALGYTQ